MEQTETFGQRLRRVRRVAVMTQEDLATLAGVSVATVGRLEADEVGGGPRPSTVKRVAKALGVDPSWLLAGGEGEELLKSAA